MKQRNVLVELFFFLLLVATVLFLLKKRSDLDFRFLSIGCDVFDSAGNLIYKRNAAGCDFGRDGSVVDITPELSDKMDRIIANADVLAHHVIKFSNDQKSILSVEGEQTRFNGQTVKADCFVVRDLEFKILKRWCLADHIKELESLEFKFEAINADYSFTKKPIPNLEISHANSINEIEDNSLSSSQPIFSKGHYLVNLFGSSGAMLVLDSEMKRILWSKNMNKFFWPPKNVELRLPTHDSQLLKDGRILSYATRLENTGLRHTYIVLWDPLGDLKKFKIVYKSTEGKDEDTPIGGQVALLHDGRYFLTETTKLKSLVLVVGPEGDVIWEFPHPAYKTEKMPFFNSGKPIYETGFLSQRGLLKN